MATVDWRKGWAEFVKVLDVGWNRNASCVQTRGSPPSTGPPSGVVAAVAPQSLYARMEHSCICRGHHGAEGVTEAGAHAADEAGGGAAALQGPPRGCSVRPCLPVRQVYSCCACRRTGGLSPVAAEADGAAAGGRGVKICLATTAKGWGRRHSYRGCVCPMCSRKDVPAPGRQTPAAAKTGQLSGPVDWCGSRRNPRGFVATGKPLFRSGCTVLWHSSNSKWSGKSHFPSHCQSPFVEGQMLHPLTGPDNDGSTPLFLAPWAPPVCMRSTIAPSSPKSDKRSLSPFLLSKGMCEAGKHEKKRCQKSASNDAQGIKCGALR